jgi:hypothetical protein
LICLQKYRLFCFFAMFLSISNKMNTRKAIVFMILMILAIIVAGCHKPDEPDDEGNNNGENDTVLPVHGFVDLGLPSGTLWATCNVGASSPEDCGDYFAWGETVTKDLYDWKSYKYSAYDGERFMLTKYCCNSACGLDGFVDNLTVLEPVDDAVRANWGEEWRMPTKEEYEELNEETTFSWTTVNGVEGRLLTGPNGNSIFFPATGFYLDDGVICTGLGIYWSSSLQTVSQVSAWSFHFDYENCHVCATYERSRGHCVRAVREMR